MLLIHSSKGPNGLFWLKDKNDQTLRLEEFLTLAPSTLDHANGDQAKLKIVVDHKGLKGCAYLSHDYTENYPTHGASWEEVLVRLDAKLRNEGILETSIIHNLD